MRAERMGRATRAGGLTVYQDNILSKEEYEAKLELL